MDIKEIKALLTEANEANKSLLLDEAGKAADAKIDAKVASISEIITKVSSKLEMIEKMPMFSIGGKFPNKITIAGKQFDLRKQGRKLLSKVEKSRNKDQYNFLNDDGEGAYTFKKWALLHIQALAFGAKNPEYIAEYQKFMAEQKADMVEGGATTGGNIVAVEYANEVILLARDSTAILDRVRYIPMTGFVKKMPKELTRVVPYFVDEMNAPTESTKTWEQLTLTAEKLGILTESISNELIADAVSGYDVVSAIFEDAANKMGLKMEYEVLRGTTAPWGADMGIMTSKITTNTVELNAGSPTAAFSGLTDVEISEAEESLPDAYQANAVLVAGKKVRHYLKTLKDKNGDNIYIGPNSAGGVPEVYGVPFLKSSQAVNTSAASTIFAVVGDLNEVAIGARDLEMNLSMDPYTDFAKDGVRFAMFIRFAEQVLHEDAFCTISTTP